MTLPEAIPWFSYEPYGNILNSFNGWGRILHTRFLFYARYTNKQNRTTIMPIQKENPYFVHNYTPCLSCVRVNGLGEVRQKRFSTLCFTGLSM